MQMNLNGCSVGDEGLLCLANAIEDGSFDHVRALSMNMIPATRNGREIVDDVLKEYRKNLHVYF